MRQTLEQRPGAGTRKLQLAKRAAPALGVVRAGGLPQHGLGQGLFELRLATSGARGRNRFGVGPALDQSVHARLQIVSSTTEDVSCEQEPADACPRHM